MQEASQLPSFSFSRSLLLFVCRRRQLLRRYFNPSGHLSPAHCGIKFPYCHATRPQRSAIVDAQRGGGYCNFYRWTGVCALTQEKNELYEMTRPIAHGHPKAEGLYMCWYIYRYRYRRELPNAYRSSKSYLIHFFYITEYKRHLTIKILNK